MRKNTSDSDVGLPAWLAVEPDGPISASTAELVVPASKSRPAILMPSTSAVLSAVMPPSGTRVARPRPSTTVSARFTFSVWFRWYTPGVISKFLPAASAAFIVAAVSPGRMTWNWLIGRLVPAGEPLAQLVPEVLVRSAGTNTW
jgi:hypothetical protein